MPPLICARCGDEDGPWAREGGRLLCEDCADQKQDQ